MSDWLPAFGAFAALLTAIGGFIAGQRRNKNDLVDQIQEERNRLDRLLAESEVKRTADTTALNARIDTLSASLNAAVASGQLNDLWIAIQDSHILKLEEIINRLAPPAPIRPPRPTLPGTF